MAAPPLAAALLQLPQEQAQLGSRRHLLVRFIAANTRHELGLTSLLVASHTGPNIFMSGLGPAGTGPLPRPEFSGPPVMDEAGAATAVLLRDVHCALLRAYQVPRRASSDSSYFSCAI